MKKLTTFFLAFSLLSILSSCNNDDDINSPVPTGKTTIYNLGEKAVAGISGTATFVENTDASVSIILDISGTPAGGVHPAHIHLNTAAESGGIALTLLPVNGNTGKSVTTFTKLDDGTAITYDQLLVFDGYINVHLSSEALGTIVSQGDIGQNALTGNTKEYDLGGKAVAGISGNITFSERNNGEALATIMLNGTPAGGSHPAHIHANTAVEGGGIIFTFNPVNGDSGMSVTNVAAADNGTGLKYSDILNIDGYVNVHLSSSALGTIVAQGDIGQNDLTGVQKVYTLNEKDVPGISGSATFFKRVNGTALAVLNIQNTPAGGMHPAHIHQNNVATGGGIAFTFNPVNGDTGISSTQVERLDNNTSITYDQILTYNGYINVHLSASQLGTIVSQGNIGSNQ